VHEGEKGRLLSSGAERSFRRCFQGGFAAVGRSSPHFSRPNSFTRLLQINVCSKKIYSSSTSFFTICRGKPLVVENERRKQVPQGRSPGMGPLPNRHGDPPFRCVGHKKRTSTYSSSRDVESGTTCSGGFRVTSPVRVKGCQLFRNL